MLSRNKPFLFWNRPPLLQHLKCLSFFFFFGLGKESGTGPETPLLSWFFICEVVASDIHNNNVLGLSWFDLFHISFYYTKSIFFFLFLMISMNRKFTWNKTIFLQNLTTNDIFSASDSHLRCLVYFRFYTFELFTTLFLDILFFPSKNVISKHIIFTS